MRVDSRTRKIVKQQEHRPNLQNPWQEWHQHFSTLLEKLTTWRQYSGSWVGKQTVFRSAGGNERWLNDESVYWRQCCSKKDNQWTSTFRSYWGQCCSKIVHDLVNPVNNRESKDTLEGNLLKHGYRPMWAYSCIRTNMKRCTPPRLIAEQCCTWRIMSYYHLQHGYDFWTMLSHSCEYWKDALTKTDCGTILFWSSKAHFIAWIWAIKWTSLMMPLHFFSLSDLTSWEKNPWRRTLSLQRWALLLQGMRSMSGWLDSSMKTDDNLKSIVSTGGKFMTG